MIVIYLIELLLLLLCVYCSHLNIKFWYILIAK